MLLTEQGAFRAFGDDARTAYYNAPDQSELFFTNLKMELYGREDGHVPMARAHNGTEMPLMNVVTAILGHVREHALEAINKSRVGESVRSTPRERRACPRIVCHSPSTPAPPPHNPSQAIFESRVQWVLTVPAIWDSYGKHFMRTAAHKAQLVPHIDSSRLLLALEPESAAIECYETLKSAHNITPQDGTMCMILDCGGGTVDIATHMLSSTGVYKEAFPVNGGPWGSTYVDAAFEELIRAMMEDGEYSAYAGSSEKVQMKLTWERIKCAFHAATTVTLDVSPLLAHTESVSTAAELLPRVHALADRFEGAEQTSVKGKYQLLLPPQLLVGCFARVIPQITAHVVKLLTQEELEPVKYVFLVGGFGESAFLHEALKAVVPQERAQIIRPARPGIAIVRGACRFGVDPMVIASRRVLKTYGVSCKLEFLQGAHREDKKEVKGSESFVTDLFDPWVRQGQQVGADQVLCKYYLPTHASQESAIIQIYATSNRAAADPGYHVDPTLTACPAVYVSDPGFSLVCELDIFLGSTASAVADRAVEVRMAFGFTEFVVEASCSRTGSKRKVTCNYVL